MTPEERALQILGAMDVTPGRGKQREDNWICVIADALREAQAEQKRKDAEISRRYMDGCMEHTVEPFLDGQRAASKKIADIIQAQEETP